MERKTSAFISFAITIINKKRIYRDENKPKQTTTKNESKVLIEIYIKFKI